MAKKKTIQLYGGSRDVWFGRGAASKVKKQVKRGEKYMPTRDYNWVAESGAGMFWNPKKKKATGRRYWWLGLRRKK